MTGKPAKKRVAAKPGATAAAKKPVAKKAAAASAMKKAPAKNAGAKKTPEAKAPAAGRKASTGAKTVPGTASVAAFLAAVPDARRRADCEAVLRMMRVATGCEPVLWGPSIVGFDRYRYRYDSGREGEMPIVGFSPRAQALVLYLLPGFDGHDALLGKLGKHTTGKSCLYLKSLADVDAGVLDALVRASVAEMRRRYPAGG